MDNTDATKSLQREEVSISGYNEVGVGCNRSAEHVQVTDVA